MNPNPPVAFDLSYGGAHPTVPAGYNAPPTVYPPIGSYPYPPSGYPDPVYPTHTGVTHYAPAPPVMATNYPPGLGYLMQINQLIVKQKKEFLEILTKFETSNVYVCMNIRNEVIFHCSEESDFCSRQFLKSHRPFVIHLVDGLGNESIRVRRPYKCFCCSECCSCLSCCQDEVEVEAPVGQTVGYVRQICDGCSIAYHILNANRELVLKICGPSYCYCECFGQNIDFPIKSPDGNTEVGKISKKWSNVIQEFFTDADTFGVSFPLDLDVRVKAVLIGAVFLIDFMFFEENQPNRN